MPRSSTLLLIGAGALAAATVAGIILTRKTGPAPPPSEPTSVVLTVEGKDLDGNSIPNTLGIRIFLDRGTVDQKATTIPASITYPMNSTHTVEVEAQVSPDISTVYTFKHWSDQVPDNPRTVLLAKDTLLTAIYEKTVFAVISISARVLNDVLKWEYLKVTFLLDGQPAPNGQYALVPGSKHTLEAPLQVTTDILFTDWIDGETSAKRTITAVDGARFIAQYCCKAT